jgi:PadR family transcriptional regulator, regulatory protein PadR
VEVRWRFEARDPLTVERPIVLDKKVSSHQGGGMRRRRGELLDLEAQILAVAVEVLVGGAPEFHGFGLAKALAGRERSQKLTAHGTLYKALGRLEDAGLLTSRWAEHELAEAEGRPRRRLYRVTGAGQAALAAHETRAQRTALPGTGIEPA